MTKAEMMRNELRQLTHSVLNIRIEDCQNILDKLEIADSPATIKVYHINYNSGEPSEIPYRFFESDDEEISRIIATTKSNQNSASWKYELVNSKGNLAGVIYTIDNNLFRSFYPVKDRPKGF